MPGPHLWSGDFETGDLSQWRTRGGGTGLQSVSDDRIRVVRSPVAQGAYSARFEVRRGDAWRGSGGNRAELMHWTGEGEGDERWYSWSTMFPPDFPRVTTGYQIVTQWHAEKPGTQPPITVYASGDRIGFRTTEANADGSSSPSVVHWSGPMSRGAWHRFLLRVRWSARREGGWVEMWHDGVRVVPRTPARTMVPGQAIYLKQGLYRSESIAPVGVVYHDGMAMHAR